jgi:hypothetical protein
MTDLTPTGRSRQLHPLKFCDKCETKRPPEGGIQMGVGRWYCASCWLKRNHKEKKK